MNIIIYSILIVATSVLISTLTNVLIMRKVSEMAAEELQKLEDRWFKLMKKIID